MSMGSSFPIAQTAPDAPFQVRDPDFRLSNLLPPYQPAQGGVHYWHSNPDIALVGGWTIEFAVNSSQWSAGQPGPAQPNPSDVIKPQQNSDGTLSIQH